MFVPGLAVVSCRLDFWDEGQLQVFTGLIRVKDTAYQCTRGLKQTANPRGPQMRLLVGSKNCPPPPFSSGVPESQKPHQVSGTGRPNLRNPTNRQNNSANSAAEWGGLAQGLGGWLCWPVAAPIGLSPLNLLL